MVHQWYLLHEQGAWATWSCFDVEIKERVYLGHPQDTNYFILQFRTGKEVDQVSSICFSIERTPLKANICSEEQNMLQTGAFKALQFTFPLSFTVILYEHY